MLMWGCGGNPEPAPTPDAPPVVAKPVLEPVNAEFTIQNVSPGYCKFVGVLGSTNILIDSLIPGDGGKMLLKRDTALPPGLFFLLLPDKQMIQFLLDVDQTFTFSADAKNIIGTAQTSGSLDMDLLYENLRWESQFQRNFQPISQKLNSLPQGSPDRAAAEQEQRTMLANRKAHLQSFKQRHPDALFTRYKLAGQNPELQEPKRPDGSIDTEQQLAMYRQAYWDNTPFSDETLLHTPIIANKLNTYITQLSPQAVDSVKKYADIVIAKSRVNREMFKFVVNWIAIEYSKPKNMGGEAVFVYLIEKYFTKDQAWWSTPEELEKIQQNAADMRPSLIGNIGQDLLCENLKGEKEGLYAMKAPYSVVWIWNYECEHCQERTPAMKKVAERYKPSGLQVYSICTGMEDKPWRAFVSKYGIQGFHNVWDPQYSSQYHKKYHIDNTPELYLLDKDHKIVAKDLHPDQLPAELDRLIAGK